MSFSQLVHVSKLCHSEYPHNLLVFEWAEKRQHLSVYLQDLPHLVDGFKNSETKSCESNPHITLVDPVPKIRLSSACEASANCLYGMAEIAAQFSNKVTRGLLPSSFNTFRKKAERGDYSEQKLKDWINDFEWYKKVRELRTEWAHFSTVFIGQENTGEPILVVRCHRRNSDREEFSDRIQIKIADLIQWVQRAIVVIDNLGDYLLEQHILPRLDVNAKFTAPKLDKEGWPIVKDDHTLEVREITVADHLAQCGIKLKN